MKKWKSLILGGVFALMAFTSCSTPLTICCEPYNTKIYIDGQFLGEGLVKYNAKLGQDIELSCTKDGLNFYKTRIYPSRNNKYHNINLREF